MASEALLAASIAALLADRGPMPARELVYELAADFPGVDKAIVNGVLYSESSLFAHDDQVPPLWAIAGGPAADPVGDEGGVGSWSESQWEAAAHRMVDTAPGTRMSAVISHIPLALPIAALPISERARKALMRGHFRAISDLQDVEVRDLMDIRGVGYGTIVAILAALMEADALSAEGRGPALVQVEDDSDAPAEQGMAGAAPSPPAAVEHLLAVARWFHMIGRPAECLLDADEAQLPRQVAESLALVRSVTAGDLVDSGEMTAAGYVEASLWQFSPRELDILRQRVCGRPPCTLEALAGQFGVTRERVRQMEVQARQTLAATWAGMPMVGMLAEAVREQAGVVQPLAAVLEAYPVLAEQVPSLDEPLWLVLDRADDAYEVVDGWLVSGSMAVAQQATVRALEALADAYGLVPIDVAADELGLQVERDESGWGIRRWAQTCRLPVMSGHVLTRSRSVADRAIAVLAIEGVPMTAEAILERLGGTWALSSMKNAMAVDPRVSRVMMGVWSLRDWGHEEYTGIRELIRAEVDRAGGRVEVESMVARLSGQFGVSENSVRTYAAAPPFTTRAGYVSYARVATHARHRRRPTKRLFDHGGEWKLRLTVTNEHLRGSGFPIQNGVAEALGLRRGGRIEIPSRLGPQAARWTGPQPNMGSIRRFLLEMDAQPGDDVFLVFGENHFDVQAVGALPDDPAGRIKVLAGLQADCPDPIVELRRAVGIPADSSIASLASTLTERGDTDLAELVAGFEDAPAAGTPGERVDDNTLLKLMR